MDVRNKGRCIRCLASAKDKENEKKLYCFKYGKYCQGIAGHCQEPCDGMREEDWKQIKALTEVYEKSKLFL